jgi:hypothetical protein
MKSELERTWEKEVWRNLRYRSCLTNDRTADGSESSYRIRLMGQGGKSTARSTVSKVASVCIVINSVVFFKYSTPCVFVDIRHLFIYTNYTHTVYILHIYTMFLLHVSVYLVETTQPATTQEYNQNSTRGLPKNFAPGPKYNWKHAEYIWSQPCTIHENNSRSEPNICTRTLKIRC